MFRDSIVCAFSVFRLVIFIHIFEFFLVLFIIDVVYKNIYKSYFKFNIAFWTHQTKILFKF